ncbi:MAG TPA: hypothetical protein VIJ52_00750 [Pseudolabrys sp.]
MSIDNAVKVGTFIGKLAAVADIVPTAILEAQSPAQTEAFIASNKTAEEYIATLRTEKPHWFKSAADNGAAIEAITAADEKHRMAKAAAGTSKIPPTLPARRAYVEKYGEADYRAMMIEYQGDHGMQRPGVNPRKKAKDAGTVVGGKVAMVDGKRVIVGGEVVKATSNPWSEHYSGKDAEQRRIAIIKSGTARAISLAKSAGTDLAGRKLRTA